MKYFEILNKSILTSALNPFLIFLTIRTVNLFLSKVGRVYFHSVSVRTFSRSNNTLKIINNVKREYLKDPRDFFLLEIVLRHFNKLNLYLSILKFDVTKTKLLVARMVPRKIRCYFNHSFATILVLYNKVKVSFPTWHAKFNAQTVDGDTSVSFDPTKCHVVPRAIVDSLFRRFHLHRSTSEVSVQIQMAAEDFECEKILL